MRLRQIHCSVLPRQSGLTQLHLSATPWMALLLSSIGCRLLQRRTQLRWPWMSSPYSNRHSDTTASQTGPGCRKSQRQCRDRDTRATWLCVGRTRQREPRDWRMPRTVIFPSCCDQGWPSIHKTLYTSHMVLVLEDDQAGRLRTVVHVGQLPLQSSIGHWAISRAGVGAVVGKTPVVALFVPDDGRQAKDLFCDGANSC